MFYDYTKPIYMAIYVFQIRLEGYESLSYCLEERLWPSSRVLASLPTSTPHPLSLLSPSYSESIENSLCLLSSSKHLSDLIFCFILLILLKKKIFYLQHFS